MKEYGLTCDKYLGSFEHHGYGTYLTTVYPFIIEPAGLRWHPSLPKMNANFVLMEYNPSCEHGGDNEQIDDIARYFFNFTINYNAISDYLEENWIQKTDIGKTYDIDYNFVGTKEEVAAYKDRIVAEKRFDIKYNIVMYRKWGQYKYGYLRNSTRPSPPSYKFQIREYLDFHKTKKKDFNTSGDKRIDLDSSMFRLGKGSGAVGGNRANVTIFKGQLYGDKHLSSDIVISVDLFEFIEKYNLIKGDKLLEGQVAWGWNWKLLDAYVNGSISKFSRTEYYLNCKLPELETLFNNFTIDDDFILKRGHANFKDRFDEYTLNPRSAYYYDMVCCLEFCLPKIEGVKIKKGTHEIFVSKSEESRVVAEAQKMSRNRLLLRFGDDQVVYIGDTDAHSNMYKGMKGKIIKAVKEFVIQDQFGRTHLVAFRDARNANWVNESTTDYDALYAGLSVSEKLVLREFKGLSGQNEDVPNILEQLANNE